MILLPTGEPILRAAALQCDVTTGERGGWLRHLASGEGEITAGYDEFEGTELEMRAG